MRITVRAKKYYHRIYPFPVQLLHSIMSDSKKLRKKLKEAFKDIDKNADGTISKSELEKYLSKKNMSKNQVDELVRKMDLDQDGIIDLKEFTYHYIESIIDVNYNKSLKEAFDNADKDKDGFIGMDEAKYLMKYFFGCSDLETFMDDVDVDKDGKINYQGKLWFFSDTKTVCKN